MTNRVSTESISRAGADLDLESLPAPLRLRAENALTELADVTTAWRTWSNTEAARNVAEGSGNVLGVRAGDATIPQLFVAFRNVFPEAAQILARSPKAMKQFADAEAAGVKFFGRDESTFVEFDPTGAVTIHIAQEPPFLVAASMLVELNNALQSPRVFEVLDPNTLGERTPEAFAVAMGEVELNSIVETARAWKQIKAHLPQHVAERHRDVFFESWLDATDSRDTLLADVLAARMPNGYTKREIFLMGYAAQRRDAPH